MAGLRDNGSHAPLSTLALRIGGAAVDALAGRHREALDAFRAALATCRDLGLVWKRVQVELIMATLLDPSLPEVRAALDDACETLGAAESPAVARTRACPVPAATDTPPDERRSDRCG